jgi:hypothetical protein
VAVPSYESGGVFLYHLQDGIEHTHNGTEGPILTLGKTAQAVEVPEKLVCTVDEMNDHQALSPGRRK